MRWLTSLLSRETTMPSLKAMKVRRGEPSRTCWMSLSREVRQELLSVVHRFSSGGSLTLKIRISILPTRREIISRIHKEKLSRWNRVHSKPKTPRIIRMELLTKGYLKSSKKTECSARFSCQATHSLDLLNINFTH